MRKAAIVLTSGFGVALLCTAVLGKEEPGSRMTFGQRMNSVFGLVDTASTTPPPPPPPGASNYRNRPQHTTVQAGGKQSAIPHNTAPTQSSGYTSNAVTPPNPRRDDGVAQAASVPTEQPLPGATMARPSILMQSRNANAQSTAAVRAAPNANSAIRPAATPSAPLPTGNIAPIPTAAGGARSGAAPVMQAPVMGSRRRPLDQRSTVDPLSDNANSAAADPLVTIPQAATPTTAPLSTAPLSTAPINTAPITAAPTPAPRSAANSDEAFIPAIPMMADRRAAGGSPSSGVPTLAPEAPATLPVETVDTASRPLVAGPTLSTQPAIESVPSSLDTQSNMSAPTTATVAKNSTAGGNSAVLAAFTSPEVAVETIGPRRISIGREAKYRVVVRNRGQGPAQNVVVTLNVPNFAEVVELHGTSGNTTSAEEHAANTPLTWQLDVLEGRAEEELTLVLVPRKSETFDLGVRWTCSPAAVATAIEVEEPQLQMTIAGPSEVSYGEQRLYKLTVLNPGTGTAENVVLHLMPLTPNDGEPVSHKIGDLKPGADTSVEVELTARQAGNLKIRTSASADGGLNTEASADVVVHRAALDVSVVAPKIVFAGVPGNYEVRVRNTGDDLARNVKLVVDLPQGTKLLTVAPAQKTEAKGNQANWTIDRLTPGAEQVFSIRCSIESGGIQQLTATTSADGDLRKTAQASTDVQSVADLALDVIDTPGPVAVGQPVTFEIHVKNRGMKSAEGVDVVAYFSEGIEPEKAEGQAHELQPGMVVFKTLTTVGAGQDRVLRVTARASAAGNHRLRVEMHGRAPQTQLSHEDSTFFYLDEAPSATSSAATGTRNPTAEHARTLRSGLRSDNTAPAPAMANAAAPSVTNVTTAAPAASASGSAAPTVNPYAAASTGAASASTRPSDSRYGNAGGEQAIPATLPQSPDAIRPATSLGTPNAPGTVFPATLPQRHRTNGLR